jgi:4-hydroxy-2-oxoheptanedioate aldolase
MRIVKILKENGMDSIKCSFEDEGVSLPYYNEHLALCIQNNLDMTLKIGGCEARSDLLLAQETGVKKVVAPMIETPFAAKKFESCLSENNFGQRYFILLESHTALKNFKKIAASVNKDKITGFVVGRSDLCRSFEMKPSESVDSDFIMSKVEKVFRISKEMGFKTIMGGSISYTSLSFIDNLINLGLLDYFETRKVVFNTATVKNLKNCIVDALAFEESLLEKRISNLQIESKIHMNRIKKIRNR